MIHVKDFLLKNIALGVLLAGTFTLLSCGAMHNMPSGSMGGTMPGGTMPGQPPHPMSKPSHR